MGVMLRPYEQLQLISSIVSPSNPDTDQRKLGEVRNIVKQPKMELLEEDHWTLDHITILRVQDLIEVSSRLYAVIFFSINVKC
jgi:ABC-type phosphate transport system ATPase subunit